MGFLFDTCTFSHWFGRNKSVESRAALLPKSHLFISMISIGEIACGHASRFATDVEKQVQFRRWIKETFEDRLLYLDLDTAEEYGRYRARLFERYGGPNMRPEECKDADGNSLGIDENDLWLAAQAKAHGLRFITTDAMRRIRAVCDDEIEIQVWPILDPTA